MQQSVPAAGLSNRERLRSLSAVIAAAGSAGLSYGYSVPLLALMLERQGYSQSEIGINAAAGPIAAILTGLLIPRLIQRLGPLNAMLWSVVGMGIGFALLPVFPGLWPWFALRFFIGGFGAVQWIVSEIWIVSLAAPNQRGRAISLYMVVLSAGFAMGPLVIDQVGIEGDFPLLLAAGLIALSLPFLLLARGLEPQLPPSPKAAFRTAFVAAPLVMMAAFLAGFTDQGVLSHLAIYAERRGFSTDMAVLLLTIMVVANLLLQPVIGWLADRSDRRRLLLLCGWVFFLAPLGLQFYFAEPFALWPLLVLWGGASLGIYTVALTILGDRFEPALLAAANSAVVALYQVGAILGPPAGGVGMDAFGNAGLMWVMASAAALFLLYAALTRNRARPR
ncbi:MAG TPA: MFS transporter [Kiloniellales bacterium]|nr:MFS transporter [Kiloniellales bacterium]